MRKKVLILTPFNPIGIGGAETYCKDLLIEARKKYDIELVTLGNQFKKWDIPNIGIMLKIAIILFRKAVRVFQRFPYKTIDAHGLIAGGVGAILKRLFKCKLIITTLALYNFLNFRTIKSQIVKWILNSADVIFVEDKYARAKMLKFSVPGNKIKIFMHWVDLEWFKPVLRERKKLTVLFIGRPIYKKGMHIIKEVERDFKQENKRIEFIYVEDAPHNELPSYYDNADIFVIPSIYDEGVARVVLEASASGLAVLASSFGSLRTLVAPFGVTFFPTPANFKEEIMKLYKSKHSLKHYQQKARRYAEQHFSPENAKMILNEY